MKNVCPISAICQSAKTGDGGILEIPNHFILSFPRITGRVALYLLYANEQKNKTIPLKMIPQPSFDRRSKNTLTLPAPIISNDSDRV